MWRQSSRVLFLLVVTCATNPVAGESVEYDIDAGASWVHVLVFKSGVLSGLGHNHVVAVTELEGSFEAATELRDSTGTIRFDVAELVVDDDALRNELGDDFAGEVKEKDKQGTRKNMLGPKLLDADNHELIEVEVRSLESLEDGWVVNASFVVRGQAFPFSVPATIAVDDNALRASGEFELSHGDIGLKPFSAAFGTLKVHPVMKIQYQVTAKPVR